jgi:hypothetical protein
MPHEINDCDGKIGNIKEAVTWIREKIKRKFGIDNLTFR